jgi:hypothetical protein
VYTLEASFCGPEQLNRHFSIADLTNMGASLGQGIYQYFFDAKTNEPIRQHYLIKAKNESLLKPEKM